MSAQDWELQISKEAGEQLRDWIISQGNARLAIVTETLMRKVLNALPRTNKHHDLFDAANNQRVEVKFSVVRRNHLTKLAPETILQCVEESKDRLIPFSQYKTHQFCCNIQHVRRLEFDMLYYGLLFEDCVKIFRIPAQSINKHRAIRSARQTKGNHSERQFHITEDNLKLHLRRYLFTTLTYEDVLKHLS